MSTMVAAVFKEKGERRKEKFSRAVGEGGGRASAELKRVEEEEGDLLQRS